MTKRFFGKIFPGGANRDQQRAQHQIQGLKSQVQELEEAQSLLGSRVHELEEELEAKRKQRQGSLVKWDWLENLYQTKCYEAHCAKQSLKEAQDEIMALKDQRIEELEGEFPAKNASSVEVKVHIMLWY